MKERQINGWIDKANLSICANRLQSQFKCANRGEFALGCMINIMLMWYSSQSRLPHNFQVPKISLEPKKYISCE